MNPSFDELDKRIAKHVILWLLVIILIAVIGKAVKYAGLNPNPALYQVVLLNNGQAYYGKLHKVHSRFPYLSDVYYLQPQQGELDKFGKQVQPSDKFTVIKRGGELHGPTDAMYLSKENIIYWENVGADSTVAQGIKADKEVRARQK